MTHRIKVILSIPFILIAELILLQHSWSDTKEAISFFWTTKPTKIQPITPKTMKIKKIEAKKTS